LNGVSGSAQTALPEGHRLFTIADEPDRWRPLDDLCSSVWPEFMLHSPVAGAHWDLLRTDWPELQFGLLDAGGRVVAAANAAPIAWSGVDADLPIGWDDQFVRSAADLAAGRRCESLGALQIVVANERRGEGLSSVMLAALRGAASGADRRTLIACVRPTEKARYPLMPVEDYAAWLRADGFPHDPWLRVHSRAGARIARPEPRSMTITGTIAEWREWTHLEFPVSGSYVAEGALAPIAIDLGADRGVYYDPNVWMIHEIG